MTATNTNTIWTERLMERPEVFPHQLNLVKDHILLAELSAAEIDAASFLDQRVLKQTTKGSWLPWQAVADSVADDSGHKPVGLIFHVGHCGSTLLSRLISFAQNTQSLREPLPLRVLAQDLADSHEGRSFLSLQERRNRLRKLLALWARGADQTVIKATSICTDLLPELHAVQAGTRSIFIYNKPETHIATLLAGQNALVDLRGFAQLRLQRLQHLTGLDIQLSDLSLGQLAALSWLSESTSLTNSLKQHSDQVKIQRFESFLQAPAETLAQLLSHLGVNADTAVVDKAIASPVLNTYSKAPDHQYNAETRATILAESRLRFRKDIKAALVWLDSLAARSELVAAALNTLV